METALPTLAESLTTMPGLNTLAKLGVRFNWNKQKSLISMDNPHDANDVCVVCYIFLKLIQEI